MLSKIKQIFSKSKRGLSKEEAQILAQMRVLKQKEKDPNIQGQPEAGFSSPTSPAADPELKQLLQHQVKQSDQIIKLLSEEEQTPPTQEGAFQGDIPIQQPANFDQIGAILQLFDKMHTFEDHIAGKIMDRIDSSEPEEKEDMLSKLAPMLMPLLEKKLTGQAQGASQGGEETAPPQKQVW